MPNYGILSRGFVVLAALLIAIPIIYSSCEGNVLGSFGNGKFQAANGCKVQGAGEVSKLENYTTIKAKSSAIPSPFSERKLLLNETSTTPSAYQKVQGDPILPDGMELVALMDNNCVRIKKRGGVKSISTEIADNRVPEDILPMQAYSFTLNQPTAAGVLEAELNEDDCVIGVSYNREYQLQSAVYNDPAASLYQDHLASVRADESYHDFYNNSIAIPKASTAKDVKVAVIDTGVSYTHGDLSDSIWRHANGAGLDARTLGTPPVNYNPTDVSTQGHGTHVSGLIAAVTNNGKGVAGVAAHGVKVMAIKVFWWEDNKLVTKTDTIIQGVMWAIEQGADVVNLSLGRIVDGTKDNIDDPVFESLIIEAINRGVVVVTAAGNGNSTYPSQELGQDLMALPGYYGEKYEGMLTVGSYDTSNGARSSFSHYSTKYVEIGAPGARQGLNGIYSTLPREGTNDKYGYLAGTSQAAPIVSAAAALTIAVLRHATGVDPSPRDVERLILESAQKSTDLSSSFKDGNRLDLKNLIDLIHERYPATRPAGSTDLASTGCAS